MPLRTPAFAVRTAASRLLHPSWPKRLGRIQAAPSRSGCMRKMSLCRMLPLLSQLSIASTPEKLQNVRKSMNFTASRELSRPYQEGTVRHRAAAEGVGRMFEDLLKGGNILTGLAIGVGALILAPVVVPVLRPLAKSVIKAGMMAYDEAMVALAELNEQAGDIFAEVRSEMATTGNGSAETRKRS